MTATLSPAEMARQLIAGDAEALRARILAAPPHIDLAPTRGDFELNPAMRTSTTGPLTPSAVLVPIVRHSEPTVLLTRRTDHLSRHAGQVAFPGGRRNADDASLTATALRETEEEIGIRGDLVTIAGFLETYETGTGYAILPVVGFLDEGFTIVPDVNEVAEVFEVPLAFLLDPANRERQSAFWQGRWREFYAFRYGGQYIWGATAAMLVNFIDKLLA